MSGIALAWCLALAGLAAFVPLHAVFIRLTGARRAVEKSVALVLVVGGALALGGPRIAGEAVAAVGVTSRFQITVHALAVYLFFSLLILSFYSALDHSVRIRLCVEFFRSGKSELTMAEVLERYGVERATSRRWDKLVYGGYVAKDAASGVLELTPKGRRAAALCHAARRIYGVK